MKILSMTATFGKLENQTLTLEPGLNILEYPNEWGKSTWCAFLMAMLYGIDTSARSKKGELADKERYAPWSGQPMSGSMDIQWEGRYITIQRWPKSRTPMGNFKAFETDTGLEVKELTAANCGQMLLGVERSVFQRSGFVQLSDLPVSQDEALRRRLNALVTTGDENDGADELGQKLKKLKNECRHNKTGRLPQAESQKRELEEKLWELEALETKVAEGERRQQELQDYAGKLKNHRLALDYALAQEDLRQVEKAQQDLQYAEDTLKYREKECENLPKTAELSGLLEQACSLQLQQQKFPEKPLLPEAPQVQSLPKPEEAQADFARWQKLEKRKKGRNVLIWIYVALALASLAALLVAPPEWVFGGIALAGVAVLSFCFVHTLKTHKEVLSLFDRYPGIPPQNWVSLSQEDHAQQSDFDQRLAEAREALAQWQRQRDFLDKKTAAFAGSRDLQELIEEYRQAQKKWQALEYARRDCQRARETAQTIAAMAKPLTQEPQEDGLRLSEAATDQALQETEQEIQKIHGLLGNYRGRMEALGSREALEKQLQSLSERIARLEEIYAALELALDTLEQARGSLQRRFAPRITQRAREIFARLTGGRYEKLTLGEDLALEAATGEEPTLRPALWRSEGTMDQLYLSLRLAVAAELTAQAPLILDDALARFDDVRLKRALELLQEQDQQILLFTCQSREKKLL